MLSGPLLKRSVSHHAVGTPVRSTGSHGDELFVCLAALP